MAFNDRQSRVRDYIMAKYFGGQPVAQPEEDRLALPMPTPEAPMPDMPPIAPEVAASAPTALPAPAPDAYSEAERAKLNKGGGNASMIGSLLAGLADVLGQSKGEVKTNYLGSVQEQEGARRKERIADFDRRKEESKNKVVADYIAKKYNLPPDLPADSAQKLATLDVNDANRDATREATIESRKTNQELARERIKNQEAERDTSHGEKLINARTNVTNKFNADKAVTKAQQSLDAANTIRDLATSGNPIASAAIPTYMARMSGEVGNLSEADKKPFGGSRAMLERMQAAFQQAATGTLTEDNKQYILGITDLIEKRSNVNLDALAKTRSEQYSAADPRMSSDEIYKMLRGEKPTLAPPPAPAPTGDISLQGDKAKRLAELRAKKAAGTLQ